MALGCEEYKLRGILTIHNPTLPFVSPHSPSFCSLFSCFQPTRHPQPLVYLQRLNLRCPVLAAARFSLSQSSWHVSSYPQLPVPSPLPTSSSTRSRTSALMLVASLLDTVSMGPWWAVCRTKARCRRVRALGVSSCRLMRRSRVSCLSQLCAFATNLTLAQWTAGGTLRSTPMITGVRRSTISPTTCVCFICYLAASYDIPCSSKVVPPWSAWTKSQPF